MPQFTPPLATHVCEIPAFAGMVCGGTGVCEWIFGIVGGVLPHNLRGVAAFKLEIPAYAGMVCGYMEVCG